MAFVSGSFDRQVEISVVVCCIIGSEDGLFVHRVDIRNYSHVITKTFDKSVIWERFVTGDIMS